MEQQITRTSHMTQTGKTSRSDLHAGTERNPRNRLHFMMSYKRSGRDLGVGWEAHLAWPCLDD